MDAITDTVARALAEDVGSGDVTTAATVAPEAPASEAYALALVTDARRVPVVDGDGRLLGVVAVTVDHARFCGTPHSTGA